MYIDIHNHVLPEVDDGARNISEAINLLKQAEQDGIEKLILTPHYSENRFVNEKDSIIKPFFNIKQACLDNNINIELYLGSEILLSPNTSSLLKERKISTLNDSKYLLVEVYPISSYWLFNLKEELYNLSLDGYKVILAHPERYDVTHNNPNFIYELVNDGHYMQINVNSLKPKHPNHKIVRKLLDANLVHFIASDAHSLHSRPLELSYGYDFLKKNYGKDYADKLFYQNQLCVIKNENIEKGVISKIRKKLFFF